MTEVEARSYGVDVASYQPSVVSYTGAKFAIVKLTEGTNYLNPKAGQQIKSAKDHGGAGRTGGVSAYI